MLSKSTMGGLAGMGSEILDTNQDRSELEDFLRKVWTSSCKRNHNGYASAVGVGRDRCDGALSSRAGHSGGKMDRPEELKSKYQSVLRLIGQKGLRMHNLHVQDNKLFIKASAGTQDLKNEIWRQSRRLGRRHPLTSAPVTLWMQSARRRPSRRRQLRS
jgi:hypothetical protein